jgi:acetyltransferase-like isoleucine patch superfamily enzyme
VLRGAVVGRGCVLAAHAVVRSEIPERSVAGGIPARVIKRRGEEPVAPPPVRAVRQKRRA